ncbi:MAG: CBS domain-containing protein [Bacteriovorax sp.]|nr:CBS domain-containing protein [Bacteriovorax sp.]
MTKAIPSIQKFMSTSPHTIGVDQTLAQAKKVMHDLSIRHLPVLKGGSIVGIISEHDINFMLSFKGVDLKNEKIDQAMTFDPVMVESTTQLDEVCRNMAEKKIGSVLIQDNHKLVGIFTWVDALKAMDELLKTRLK